MQSRDDKDLISQTFTKYFGLLALKEHNKALDYVYPPLFKIIPRKDLLKGMKGTDKSVDIKLTELSINKISRVSAMRGIHYRILDYQFLTTLTYPRIVPEIQDEDDDPEDEEDNRIDFMFEIFRERHGAKNVKIDRNRNSVSALVKNQVFCIADPAFEGWKFLEKKEGSERLLEKLINQ